MKCFHHTDGDGYLAAFWVRWYTSGKDYKNFRRNTICEFIGVNYGCVIEFDKIRKDEIVYIVDYSFSVEDMDKLLQITSNVIWIDHHRTAIELFDNYPTKIEGLRVDGVAASMLTYYWFTKNELKRNLQVELAGLKEDSPEYIDVYAQTAPKFTQYIADYDVWRFQYGGETKHFMCSFDSYENTVSASIWVSFLIEYLEGHSNFTEKLVEDGKNITEYMARWNKQYCNKYGYIAHYDKYIAYVVNIGLFSNDMVKGVDGEFDFYAGVCYNDGIWRVSLRSKLIDVSEIAKKFGGGGHYDCAGFWCEKLPF